MRLSHKRKIAHKKGVYHSRLTYSLLRTSSAKWQKRLARQLEKSKGPVMIEINSIGGEVGGFDKVVKAFKQLAEIAVHPFKSWSPFAGVTNHGNT